MKAALVSYLNTKPFLEGLSHAFDENELEMSLLPPSECARALAEKQCDIALVPVGSLFDFDGVKLLKDYCIGADGPVDSVFLFADNPVEALETVLEDPHSRTSNLLTRLLFRMHWKTEPTLVPGFKRDFSDVAGNIGKVAIGDLAHQYRKHHAYTYDLSEIWKQATGLPFVFAVWAYRPGSLTEAELEAFSKALAGGLERIPQAAARYGAEYGYAPEEALNYLTNRIQFRMDAEKHQALALFFAETANLLGEAIHLST